jgi:rsbT antagonist protein RsbS
MAKVMGCQTIVVGLQPEVAITLMELGLHLEGIDTALNTETGLELLEQLIDDKTSINKTAPDDGGEMSLDGS